MPGSTKFDWEALWPQLLDHISTGGTVMSWCQPADRPCRDTVYKFMNADDRRRDEWMQAYVSRAYWALDDYEVLKQEIRTGVLSGKEGGHLLKAAQWDLEKLLPKFFGQRRTVSHEGGGLATGIMAARERASLSTPVDVDFEQIEPPRKEG